MNNVFLLVLSVSLLAAAAMYVFGSGPLSPQYLKQDTSNPSQFVVVQTASGPLWVAQEETSVAQWLDCVRDGACESIPVDSKNLDHPLTGVNWRDVSDFLKWYRKTYDTPVRLPSQTEWLQFAADAFSKPKKKLFDDPRLAWAADYDLMAVPQSKTTEPAGSFGSNQHAINDLKGNVWEWTETCQIAIDPTLKESYGCISGRYAMGQHVAVLSDMLRTPGNAGCGGSQPPANVGIRLVWQG